MLTATYSLVAIAAEQDKARSLLYRLQQYIHVAWKGLQGLDSAFLETAYGKLVHLDGYCRARKIETYLVPALRSVARETEEVLSELDGIGRKCMETVRHIGGQLAASSALDSIRMNGVLQAMETYCGHQLYRFEKEEKELLPMARRLFSVEEWFAIAANFLSDGDVVVDERKRRSRTCLRSRDEHSPSARDMRMSEPDTAALTATFADREQ
jgi:hypothetical protein